MCVCVCVSVLRIYIYIYIISSPKTVGVDYFFIEYMGNIIYIYIQTNIG